MKFVKGLLSLIVSSALFFLLLFYSLNMIFKGVIQKKFIGGIAKEEIITDYLEQKHIDNIDEVKKIFNDKKTEKIMNNLITDYMLYLSDNNHQVSKKTVQSIVDFCVEHKDEINNVSNSPVTADEIKSQETFDNISKSINDGFSDISKNIGDTPKEIVKIYGKMLSNNIKIVLIILITICVILLIIIKNSFYSWLSTFGSSLISIGILISGLYLMLDYIIKEIIKRQIYNLKIDVNKILVIGIIEIILGIVMIVAKKIIDKIINNKKSNNNINNIEQEIIISNPIEEKNSIPESNNSTLQ